MDRMRSKPLLVGVVLLVATVCTTAPTPSPSPSPSPAASQVATIVLSPSPPHTCETTQIEAQAAVATTTATVIATCLTCSGRFPPPSPGVAPITAEAKLSLVAQGTFRGEIVFPRGGTWRFDSPDLPLPVTRPTVQVVDLAVPPSCS
jgi:hypothetical protein